MINKSIIFNCDSYKVGHHKLYNPKTTFLKSYIESREGSGLEKTVFFGLQMFIKEYLLQPITHFDIDIAENIFKKHVPGVEFNRKGWEYIVKEHNGKLPIKIKAIPEGSVINRSNVLLTVENTDPNCSWLTSYVETAILRSIWYPTTIASEGYVTKNLIEQFYIETFDKDYSISLQYTLNDFGARGVSSFETSGIGGLAHLVNFSGTDNITSLLYANNFYHSDVCAQSVYASEHSIMSQKGEEGELEVLERIINEVLKPNTIVSVVADTYNIYRFCNDYLRKFKEEIKNSGGKLVVRPDTGIPSEIDLEVIEILGEVFGYNINSYGYKELPPYIGIIQGDGIDTSEIWKILSTLKEHKWSSNNIIFGSGGALLQKSNRDTMNFAMKNCYNIIDGYCYDVMKKPIHGSKSSKSGDLTLIKESDIFKSVTIDSLKFWEDKQIEFLEVIFENGNLLKEYSFEQIRKRVEEYRTKEMLQFRKISYSY